ncbi:MAG TPA: ABC transporter substrate-binding protein [Candidatus Lustribacter sp.]|jgi:branched-chain amino acid transport system substrate-binding protein|nr:ABC transporter substrate-binding protein [Candidatus Lustribacter sp.]
MKKHVLAVTAALTVAAGLAGAAAQQPPLRIGLIYSYSGAPPINSKLFDDGIDLYIKQHGDVVAGRKIEVIRRDDTGLAPDVARRVATELIVQDHVDALLGMLLTPNTVAVESVSAAAKKPLLIVNSASSHILERDPYAVRFGYTMPQLTEPLAQWAMKNGIKTAYILYQDYGPGTEAATSFTKSFTALGGTIVATTAFPVETKDFSAYIQRIKDAKPQAVYAFINGGGTGPFFVRAADAAGFKKAGITILAANDLIAVNELNLASDFSVDLIQVMDYTPSHPSAANRAFVRAFATLPGPPLVPDFGAVAAYDALGALYGAIAAQNGNLDPDKTMDYFRGLKVDSPRGPVVIDPKTRDIVENIYVRRVSTHGGTAEMREIGVFPMVRDSSEE